MTESSDFFSPLDSEKDRYRATLLIPKGDTLAWENINNAIAMAVKYGIGKQWQGMYLGKINMPIADGDIISSGHPLRKTACKGHHVIVASSKSKPDIVDSNLQPITKSSEIYDGIYVRASLTFFAHVANGLPYIYCSLGPIMKMSDGDYIPQTISLVQYAFGDGAVPQAPSAAPNTKPAKAESTIKSELAFDNDNPPWNDADLPYLDGIAKDRSYTLEEFTALAAEPKQKS